jgi:superfamily II DNA/RNA helicase
MADGFGAATRHWFENAFEAPTPVQRRGWERIRAGDHTLLIAPTGSGKTLAAFLWAVDRLTLLEPDAEPGVRVVYVSPLKALVYDIERNLRVPLRGIERAASALAPDPYFDSSPGPGPSPSPSPSPSPGLASPTRIPTVDVRTGDTTPDDRRRQARNPAEILVTTPESLFLILGSQARETLRTVQWIIVDEIHAMAGTKRGAHLAVSLERLSHLADREPQRIGLSATARPTTEVARFLGGDREVSIVDAHVPPMLDLQVVVPVEDMTRPVVRAEGGGTATVADGARTGSLMLAEEEETTRQYGIWPAVYPKLLELIRGHRTTIVFVNSRGLCERLAQHLNEEAGEELVRAHHGSLAHEQRREIEESLKAGRLRAIVATSSLELGIDMGAVDLVVLVESPGSVASGLQRVGRAGHSVGEVSIGRIFPKHRGDLLEAAIVDEVTCVLQRAVVGGRQAGLIEAALLRVERRELHPAQDVDDRAVVHDRGAAGVEARRHLAIVLGIDAGLELVRAERLRPAQHGDAGRDAVLAVRRDRTRPADAVGARRHRTVRDARIRIARHVVGAALDGECRLAAEVAPPAEIAADERLRRLAVHGGITRAGAQRRVVPRDQRVELQPIIGQLRGPPRRRVERVALAARAGRRHAVRRR